MANSYDIFFQQADAVTSRLDKLRQLDVENKRAGSALEIQRQQQSILQRRLDEEIAEKSRLKALENVKYANSVLGDVKFWRDSSQDEVLAMSEFANQNSAIAGLPKVTYVDPRHSALATAVSNDLHQVVKNARTIDEARQFAAQFVSSLNATLGSDFVDKNWTSIYNSTLANAPFMNSATTEEQGKAGEATANPKDAIDKMASQQANTNKPIMPSNFLGAIMQWTEGAFGTRVDADIVPLNSLTADQRKTMPLGMAISSLQRQVEMTPNVYPDIKLEMFEAGRIKYLASGLPDLSDKTTRTIMIALGRTDEFQDMQLKNFEVHSKQYIHSQQQYNSAFDRLVYSVNHSAPKEEIDARRLELWRAERAMKIAGLNALMSSTLSDGDETAAALRREIESETTMPATYGRFAPLSVEQAEKLKIERTKASADMIAAMRPRGGGGGGGGGGGSSPSLSTLLGLRYGTMASTRAANQEEITAFNKDFKGTRAGEILRSRDIAGKEAGIIAVRTAYDIAGNIARSLNRRDLVPGIGAQGSSGGVFSSGSAPKGPLVGLGHGLFETILGTLLDTGGDQKAAAAAGIKFAEDRNIRPRQNNASQGAANKPADKRGGTALDKIREKQESRPAGGRRISAGSAAAMRK